ncbi:nucleic acid-binding protein [Morchella conica CCBAS932]|uniref:rRNA biogenesis protein RRP5 n=1 Tax=Morchella conica CCBAS932 TaxID=1392247 RepID=A0A3N4KHY8_9PEZI|nr:nucleic acid-binding protein [Morchella conica CCBAS932]
MAPEKKRKRPQEGAESSPAKKPHVKKSESAAITAPAAPTAPSTLRSMKDDESSFPRGGASALTPLEFKQVSNEAARDVLFESGGAGKTSGEDGGIALKKGKKKPKRSREEKKEKKEDQKKEDKGPYPEGLSFKRLASGMLILGCISKINATDLAIALPNNLTGFVPLTSISETFTKKIESLIDESEDEASEEEQEEKGSLSKDEKDAFDLNAMFRVGQYLRTYVVHSIEDVATKAGSSGDQNKTKRRIELSLDPSLANSGLTPGDLVVGCTVQASISSVEDHGLVMELGISEGIKGFLTKKELGHDFTMAKATQGQVLLCTVTGIGSNGKIIKLSADLEQKPSKKGKIAGGKGAWWVSQAPTINAFLPGTGVEVLVTEVGKKGGLVGKIMGMLDATIDYFHIAGWKPEELGERFKIGEKIKARVTITFPSSDPQKVAISVLPHILAFTPPAEKDLSTTLPIATILPTAKIIDVKPKVGLFLETGISGIPGFVHISRVSSETKVDDLSKDSGPYKLGTIHEARVIGFNAMDGIYLLSTEKRVLEQPYLRIEDIKIGETVKGKIQKVLERGGVTVNIADGISGFVSEDHLSDVKLKSPEKKFREGVEVRCRVLSTNPEKRQLRLTLKKTLVNSDAPLISDYESVTPGIRSVGTLIKIMAQGAIVQFYAGVSAYLPVSEMSEAYIQDPKEHFRVGQSVNVHILSVDPESKKMRVSCKDPNSFGEEQKEALKALEPGSLVSGTVVEKSDDDLIVEIKGGLKGVLIVGQLTDGSRQKNVNAFKKLRAGQTLSDLVVLAKNEKRRLITLSMKPSLAKAAKSKELLGSFEDVEEGKSVKGWVYNITLAGVFVAFAGGLVGLAVKKDLPTEVQSLPDFKYVKDQSVTAKVTRVNQEKRRFFLSLKPESELEVREPKEPKDPNLVTPINPVDEKMTSLADFTPGTVTKVVIVSVQQTQINVRLADNIQGRIDVSQIFDSWESIKNKKSPLESYKKGDVIPAKILGIHDARNHRFLAITHKTSNTKTPIFELSAKPSVVAKGSLNILTIDQVTQGSSWVVFVNNIAEECVWVNISPDIRGRIRRLDLSEDVSQLNDLPKNFPIGSALKARVLSVDTEHKKLNLSARPLSASTLTYDQLSKGVVVPARVTKVSDRQVIVQLSESASGPINLTDIADDFSEAKVSNFRKNDIIRVCVLDLDKPNKRITLSARPSRVLSSTLTVRDPEVQTIANINVGDVRRGFVKNVSDKGLFVSLGGNVTAWVKVSDLADTFLKDWKSMFTVDQLVEGKIVAVEKTLGHVQMSLRPSAISGELKKQTQLSELKAGQIVTGRIKGVVDFGVFIQLDNAATISGLCHKTQIADGVVEDIGKLYAEGDPVKAKILKVDVQKGRVSFGLKASFFEDEDSDDDASDGGVELDDEDSDGEEDSDEDGDINLEDVKDFDSDAEESDKGGDVDMEDAPVLAVGEGLSAGGFDWTGSILDKREHDAASESENDGDQDKQKKKKRKKSKIKEDMTGDMATREPQSVADHERILLGDPNNSVLWIQYLAFQLQLSEIEKAREIAERAIKTIDVREEKEKLNVWIAMLNMENAYGNDETLQETFKRACQYNDSQDVHERLASIYIQSGKTEKAGDLFKVIIKKFSQDPKVWVNYADYLLTNSNREEARELLKRAMQTLPQSNHKDLITKFAKLEFKNGDPERGRTLFENLLGTFNKKNDLWNVFLDVEMKYGGESDDNKETVRELFRRALAEDKCSARQARGLFKKWMEYEKKVGDEKSVEVVTRKAKEYVDSKKGKAE